MSRDTSPCWSHSRTRLVQSCDCCSVSRDYNHVMITFGVTSMTIRVILILFLLMVCVSMILLLSVVDMTTNDWLFFPSLSLPPSLCSDNSWLGSQRRAHSSGSFHFEANEVDCHYRYLYIIAHVTCMWLLHSYGGNGGPISAGVHCKESRKWTSWVCQEQLVFR